MTQRDAMRYLVGQLGFDKGAVVRAYAQAESAGTIQRNRNSLGIAAETYAERLWEDGVRKGWLTASRNPSSTAISYSSTVMQPASTDASNSQIAPILEELDKLIGLATVKKSVRELINLIRVNEMRAANGLKTPRQTLHLVLLGNAGTGKTTVARLISRIYHAIGVIRSDCLVEATRGDLVAEYSGQTIPKVRAIVKRSLGGVLFIDEAYSLASGSYGEEAIAELLTCMENYREDLVVIAAGYPKQMRDFLKSNPGVSSRFAREIELPDYSQSELFEIFARYCEDTEHILDDAARELVKHECSLLYDRRTADTGNARSIRNFYEEVIRMQANRLSTTENPSRQELMMLTEADIPISAHMHTNRPLEI